nr:protein saal1 isoform X1 [Ipomoea batatas]
MSSYAVRVQRKGHQQEKKPGKSMVVFYGILLQVKLMLNSWCLNFLFLFIFLHLSNLLVCIVGRSGLKAGLQEKGLISGLSSLQFNPCTKNPERELHFSLVLVQNLILEVLFSTLVVSKSARITEISLGIIGNLACHELSREKITSTNGLIGAVMEQLFLDDTPCLCEACRYYS